MIQILYGTIYEGKCNVMVGSSGGKMIEISVKCIVVDGFRCKPCDGTLQVSDIAEDLFTTVPNDTAYKRWSCHSGLKLLCNLCRTFSSPTMGADAGHADPLDGWRCCSQKQVMSRPIQVRRL